MMRRPFENKDQIIEINYNILQCYNNIKKNKKFSLVKKNSKLKIIKSDHSYNSWNDWAREVVWYGHRSGIYTCKIEDLNDNSKDNKIENEKSSNIIGNSYIV